jgi:Fe-S cluster assembly scaffold IscU
MPADDSLVRSEKKNKITRLTNWHPAFGGTNLQICKFTTMAYSEKVIDHYQNPKNVGTLDKSQKNVGTGLVGAPECGDVMRLQIEVDETTGMITDAKFKTFGCGSAIASSSLATEWLKGKSVDDALKIDNMDIVEELNLPPVKIHCSVLAEDAIKAAINDYRVKNNMEAIKFEESAVH